MADDTNTAEREAFEAWFRREYHSRLDRNMPDKSYNDPGAHFKWIGWSARASLAASAGIACQCCGGSGEVFEHSEDCDDDLCALNGDEHSCTGVVRQCSCKASPIAVGATQTHIAAMERAWLWMENQADAQSKGGHATFDLLMLREERDALRAAIDAAASAGSEPVAWPKDAAEVRAFIGSQFERLQYGKENGVPHENDRYTLTSHDLLSAFRWWSESLPSPQEGMAGWKPTFDMRAVVAVAVTMLYETHPKDVCRVFDLRELEKIVNITELLGSQQVEDIYRSAWDHLAAPPLPASEAKGE